MLSRRHLVWLIPHLPSPVSKLLSLFPSLHVRPRLRVTGRRGRRGGREWGSQIITQQESQVLYQSFNTLWVSYI
jgi:hypothetical protein